MPKEPGVELKNHLKKHGIITNTFIPEARVADHTRKVLIKEFPELESHIGQARDKAIIQAGLEYFRNNPKVKKKVRVDISHLIEPVHSATCEAGRCAFFGITVPKPRQYRLDELELNRGTENPEDMPVGEELPSRPPPRMALPGREDLAPPPEAMRPRPEHDPPENNTINIVEMIPTHLNLAQAVRNGETGKRMHKILLADLDERKGTCLNIQAVDRKDMGDAITRALKNVPNKKDGKGVFSHVLYEVNKVILDKMKLTSASSSEMNEIEDDIRGRDIEFDDLYQKRAFIRMLQMYPHAGTVAIEHIIKNNLHDDEKIIHKLGLLNDIMQSKPDLEKARKKTMLVLNKNDEEVSKIDKDLHIAREDEAVVDAMRKEVKMGKDKAAIDKKRVELTRNISDIIRS